MISFFKRLYNKFRKPKVWFTSDLHFDHRNVIAYCNRPYANAHEMNLAIEKYWNDTVGPNDTIYILGDFGINGKAPLKFGKFLNGKKILICGNHDGCWKYDTRPKGAKLREQFLEVFQEIEMQKVIQLGGKNVLLTHLPYLKEETLKYDQRYKELRPVECPLYDFHLHGHLHCKYRKRNNEIDVGFDGNLKFWSEEEIIQLMNDKRSFIPSPITGFYEKRLRKQ